jgi:hypothetical protein
MSVDGGDDQLKKQLARLGHKYGLEYEMVRATAAFEHAVLKPLFLLNGGALIATLTLYGALRGDRFNFLALLLAILGWVVGLCMAAASAFFAAYSQFAFRKLRSVEVALEEKRLNLKEDRSEDDLIRDSGRYQQQGNCRRQVAVGFGLISLLFFLISLVPAFLARAGT